MDAVQDAGGVPQMAEIVSLWTLYVQEMLNRIWDAYLYGGSAPQPAGPPAVPPPPA
jgi:hypothetical protein